MKIRHSILILALLGASCSAKNERSDLVITSVIPPTATATVGFNIFNGLDTTALPAGAFVRTIFHLEGKLLDGQYVHTSEREYLFQVCRVAGCGTAGPWAAVGAGGVRVSCL